MCHYAHNAKKVELSGAKRCRGLGYAGNQLQQNSSGPSQKAIMGAMISRHQAGVEYQKQQRVWVRPLDSPPYNEVVEA